MAKLQSIVVGDQDPGLDRVPNPCSDRLVIDVEAASQDLRVHLAADRGRDPKQPLLLARQRLDP